jgi:tetratricopeptide (TPR) repeat protein
MIHHTYLRAVVALSIAASAEALSTNALAQRAQPVVANEDPNALLRQADAAYEVRDFARALQLFRRAYELQRDPTILFNVGRMYAALEQWTDAAATWTLYLERVSNAPNRASTEAAIRDAEARAQAQRAGQQSASQQNTAPQSAPRDERVVEQGPPPPRTEPRQRWPLGGWVLTGIGGAVTVTGAVLLGLYGVSVAELNSPAHCTPRAGGGYDCDADAVGIRDRAQTFGTAGSVALSVGGAMVVGGLVWAFAGRTTEMVPVVSVGHAGASVGVVGRF